MVRRTRLAALCFLPASIAIFLAAGAAHAETIKTGGTVINETWTPDGSPYIVQGDLTVPSGASLTIEAGTIVQFASTDAQGSGQDPARTELIINGSLTVHGSAAQPVQFVGASPASGSWYGLVVGPTASAVTIANLQITNPRVGIHHLATAATVDTSAVSITTPSQLGMKISAGSPTYGGVTVVGTGGHTTIGFVLDGSASPTLTGCLARNLASGILFTPTTSNASATVVNCTLNASTELGIANEASSPGTMTVKNTIVTNATEGIVQLSDSGSVSTVVSNSDVWNNATNFRGPVTQGPVTFASNPLYVSSANLRLTANSPGRFSGQGGSDLGALPFLGDDTPLLEGVLWTPMTFTAAHGPYAVAGDLTVGPGVTVTIEPGATLTFAATDGMLAGDTARGELGVRGTLVAGGDLGGVVTLQGSSATPGSWGGVVIERSATAVTMSHVVIASPNIGIRHLATAAAVDTSAVSIATPNQFGMEISAGSPTYEGVAVAGTGANSTTGFLIDGSASPTLTSCQARNMGSDGIRFNPATSNQSAKIVNCTLNANGENGIVNVALLPGTVTVTNTIVTNTPTGILQSLRSGSVSTVVSFSDMWNNATPFFGPVTQGDGNLSLDPHYVSSTDLSLQRGSVCIDTGSSVGAPPRDVDGVTRPLDGDGSNGAELDLGAHEFVLVAGCGNGKLEPGEACDSGARNGSYNHCNATCTGLGEHCGDGVKNGPEDCDDGNTSNNDACLNTCVAARCGDGIVEVGVEDCDDGNTTDTDACTASCHIARCGDGIVQTGVEQCDDGNQDNTDACLDTCVPARCGDGFVQAGVEQCDDGNTSNTDACLNTCVAASCGDGFVQAGVEDCDDGNHDDTDGCVGACKLARCGDGFVETGVEACDDGNDDNTDACLDTCVAATCGDGVTQIGFEECDDGNQVDTDACRNSCLRARCGDGVIQTGIEECDDGNQIDTDACTASCRVARCGDGITEAGAEECDDGNQVDSDGCRNTCVLARCGDGIVQTGVEDCDDGNRDNTDACTNACTVARCGDGIVQTGVEECDDGNTASGDGCTSDCRIESIDRDPGDPGDPGHGGGCCSGSAGGQTAALCGLAVVLSVLRRRRRARAQA
jgi:cysteine-rich repeat protein